MPLSVSSILDTAYSGSVYESQTTYRPEKEGIQKIAPIDSQPNKKLPQDKFTPSNYFINNEESKLNETYDALGKKSTFSATIKSKQQNNSNEKTNGKSSAGVDKELTPEEKKAVEVLQKADKMVRAHEQAHKSVGGNLVRGGANFTYTSGPDGKVYATGGEVQIDISPVKDNPEATIQKMNQVRAAALAPADPSSQDRSVAALAQSIAANARAEAMKQDTKNIQTAPGTKEKLMEFYKNNESENQGDISSQFSGIGGRITSLKGML